MDLKAIVSETDLIFFSLLLLIPLFYLYFKHILSKNPPLPPGPFAWPIVGNFFQMGRQLHSILANLAKVHGPLMCLRLGTQISIIASSPEAAREVLRTHDRELSGRFIANAIPLINPKPNNFSLAAAPECNDYWRSLRAICKADLFSAKVLESQNHIREKKVRELVDFLGSKEGEVVNLGEAICVTYTNILTNAIFSVDFMDFEGKDLLIAGTDSSSMVTEWAMAELMRNQDVMHKLREEIESEIGTNIVKESHLSHLPYLEACVKETLRLYPPGPLLILHRALQTCQVMGYTIPKDSFISVNIWAIGRDPMVFNDPLSFKPERFLDSSLDFKGTNFDYTPFGAGRRGCPGQPLATRQVPLMLASLVHSFDWFLPGSMKSTELDMNDHFAITLKKKQPLQLIPKRRK
ncbi:(S)-N-methylcoclaurine 3'-hydroxylase isozyme 1-like [Quercus lobata]|uniref:Cytochrome P450 n=1 Tax=Quercus lobata TaxID=97700 RepID=A0A7N2MGD5_QUELO|nr:(S)-N-methylcoclaurine 3'-hydroxylase isozyme 1-like [Quercus lobata]